MTRYPVPEAVYKYWKDHPNASGAEIARATGLPERSVSRYRRYLHTERAVEIQDVPRARSKHLEEVEAIEEAFDPYEFFERAPKMVELAQQRDPIVTHDELRVDTDRPIGIVFVSCAHLGGRYTVYTEFRELYDKALSIPNLYWGSLGDDIEGFLSYFPDVKSIDDQLLNPTNQIILLETLLTPLAQTNRLLFGCTSQHGGKWERKRSGHDSVKDLYVKLKVPYFDGIGYVRLNVGHEPYHIAWGHEMPGTSQWNPNQPHVKASRFRFPMADIIVAGDKHTSSYQYFPAFMDEFLMGNRPSPMVLYLQAGTAKTGPDPYTIARFPQGELGWPIVILYPDRHMFEVTPYLDRAEQILRG